MYCRLGSTDTSKLIHASLLVINVHFLALSIYSDILDLNSLIPIYSTTILYKILYIVNLLVVFLSLVL